MSQIPRWQHRLKILSSRSLDRLYHRDCLVRRWLAPVSWDLWRHQYPPPWTHAVFHCNRHGEHLIPACQAQTVVEIARTCHQYFITAASHCQRCGNKCLIAARGDMDLTHLDRAVIDLIQMCGISGAQPSSPSTRP